MIVGRHVFVCIATLSTLGIVCTERANAVPSFSRQTGLACNVCHSNPPELTAFGRLFKLNGYTLIEKKADVTIEDKDLKINRYFPLSVMLLLSDATARDH